MNTRPLRDVRILDLTDYFAGPFGTMILSGLGSEVIQVERREIGNTMRNNPPLIGTHGLCMKKKSAEDMSLISLKRGRNKKSITLDIRTPKGKALFLDLVKISDVVIENFSYGVMDRLNLSYEDLIKVNESIIYCSISGFGRKGPNKKRVAYDIVAQAMSGFMEVTGFPDSPPLKAGIMIGDAIPGLFSVIGIISAIYQKNQTGQGQKIDISMQDCLLSLVYDEGFDALKQLGIPARVGNRNQRLAPYNSFEAKDGYFVLGAVSNEQFENLLRTIERDELISDPHYDSVYKRAERGDEIDELISQWARTKTKLDAVEALLNNHVPAGPVLAIDELIEDPHLSAHKMVVDLVHPTLGVLEGVNGPGFPIKFSGCPDDYDQAAPMLGQNNQEVYGKLLGLNEETLYKLKEDKII